MTLFSTLRVLRYRDFAVLWGSGVVSDAGTWMQAVAVGALVTEMTGQARWTGLVAAATFLPLALLSPVGGVFADRYDRKHLLMAVAVAQAVLALGLAVLVATGMLSPAILAAFVMAEGACAALAIPGRQAILPDLVPPEELLEASSLGQVAWNSGRILGPPLAGALIVLGGFTPVFVVNAATFLVVLGAVASLRLPQMEKRPPRRFLGELREGLEVTFREEGCRASLLIVAVAGLLVAPFIALIPVMAQVVLEGRPRDTSLLVTAQGIGAVLGALSAGPLAGWVGRRNVVRVYLIITPLAVLAYSAAPNLALAFVALVPVGFGYTGQLAALATVVRLRAPAAQRARVLSIFFLGLALYPLGAVVQGTLADTHGLRVVEATGAVLYAAFLLGLWGLRPSVFDALDAGTARPEAQTPLAASSRSAARTA